MSMLRNIRERKGLTLGQLAARASIPSRTLTEYEEGRQPIPLSHAKLLAKALWVQIEDLMPPAGSTPPPPRPAAPAPPAPQPRPAAATPSPAPPSSGNGVLQAGPAPQPTYQARTAEAPAPPRPAPVQHPTHGAGVPPREVSAHGAPARPSGPGGPPRSASGGRPVRPPRPAPSPPKPISEGQTEELLRLASRLEMDQPELETKLGKSLGSLTRSDAKDWIKKLRDQVNEESPGGKVHYGQWPGSREDEEALYLAKQRDAGTTLVFKLFNGDEFRGKVIDFTPYTITIQVALGGEEMVLRKLAIIYYRQVGGPAEAEPAPRAEATPAEVPAIVDAGAAAEHSHPTAEEGVDSDRTGEPIVPERDHMDEDRGV